MNRTSPIAVPATDNIDVHHYVPDGHRSQPKQNTRPLTRTTRADITVRSYIKADCNNEAYSYRVSTCGYQIALSGPIFHGPSPTAKQPSWIPARPRALVAGARRTHSVINVASPDRKDRHAAAGADGPAGPSREGSRSLAGDQPQRGMGGGQPPIPRGDQQGPVITRSAGLGCGSGSDRSARTTHTASRPLCLAAYSARSAVP